jgi:HlyD family secretion protein
MARAKKRSRLILTLIAGLLIGAALAAAFWPRAILVDLGEVTRGPMMVTIDEEGRTRVAEAYVVSTPVAGRLLRVEVDPGDVVKRGETVVARMLPSNPAALDIRTREQAMAAVQAAEAGLRVARADLNASMAQRDFAATELDRAEQLAARQIASEAALDRARQAFRVAQAAIETSEAAISMRQAELANVQAQLIGFDDQCWPRPSEAAREATRSRCTRPPTAGSCASCSRARPPCPPARRSWRSATWAARWRSWSS